AAARYAGAEVGPRREPERRARARAVEGRPRDHVGIACRGRRRGLGRSHPRAPGGVRFLGGGRVVVGARPRRSGARPELRPAIRERPRGGRGRESALRGRERPPDPPGRRVVCVLDREKGFARSDAGGAARGGVMWTGIAKRAATDFLDMLLDRRCPGCGGSPPRDGGVCDRCDGLVDRTGVALCLRCLHGDAVSSVAGRGCPSHGSDRLLLAGPAFEPPLDRLIHAFKYEGARALSTWIASLLPSPPGLGEGIGREYILVPVPLHPARCAWRGFDQTALLAGHASARWGVPVVDALVRTRDHEPQARLDPERRRTNVSGAF